MTDQLDIFRHQPVSPQRGDASGDGPPSEAAVGTARLDESGDADSGGLGRAPRTVRQLTELPGTTFEDIFGGAA